MFSFTSEIRNNIIEERQKQLGIIENTISTRMEELISIAYHIGDDKSFYLENISDRKNAGYEMTSTLDRYLVGNDFITYLSYYRLSEPDTIYTSKGELPFHDFYNTYLNFTDDTEESYLEKIQSSTNFKLLPASTAKNGKAYITCICALPQFSKNPQAFILMHISTANVIPILESQLTNCYGEVAVFDSSGNILCQTDNLEQALPIKQFQDEGENIFRVNGKKYIRQEIVSASNGWTYVSIIRLNDMISSVAAKQLFFIAILLLLMFVAIMAMLLCIMIQYKPINSLAMKLSDNSPHDSSGTVIDEKSLLSHSFASLKDDSEQKQKFENAFYEAEAANKAKSAFLSNMSHDIRTPMNAIVGMTEIAIKHSEEPEYVKECLQNVRVASQYLLNIINNVLDMSRIESGRITLAKDMIEFPKLTGGIITILNHSLYVKGLNLIVEIDQLTNETVIGDSIRLTQVFMNILSNSVKFTPNGGTLSFHINQADAGNGYGIYTFTFSDTGMGMSPEFTRQVFETFTRDERVNITKIEGTGLGMAIAKSIVELMGGTISCESELGKGTTFTVVLPMKYADEAESHKELPKYPVPVLILGSEKRVCTNQAGMFQEFGAKADYSLTLQDALKKAKQAEKNKTPYQFVIINQSDQDRSGIVSVTQLSQATDATNTTYVLAARDLSSVNQSTALNSGITTFVQIPLFRSTVLGILNKTYELHHAMKHKTVIDLTGMRVLLVEDNNMNRTIATALIRETNADVVETANGKEAVEAYQSNAAGYFDVILMDVQMPVMNGYEATAAIRSTKKADSLNIPIYAMTANTFDEDVRQVREAGMNGHLGKPYVPQDLYQILEQCSKK